MTIRVRRSKPGLRPSPGLLARHRAALLGLAVCALGISGLAVKAQTSPYPVTPAMRDTAQRVAQTGVPLEDLAPNAPDSHTVQRGDTLWGISSMFLKSAWRWPELWGMNLQQIRNPHLIYPGQVLFLEKKDGRAVLRFGQGTGEPTNTVRLSPRVRSQLLANGAIAAIPLNAIGPFLTEAVVFDDNQLDTAPRIVATQEGRVMVSRGETAYVRGDLAGARDFRIFRELKPLVDPVTREVLGHEGRYVGTAEHVATGNMLASTGGSGAVVPDSFRITSTRLEAGIGDRLSPVPQQELVSYVPHPRRAGPWAAPSFRCMATACAPARTRWCRSIAAAVTASSADTSLRYGAAGPTQWTPRVVARSQCACPMSGMACSSCSAFSIASPMP